MTVKNNRKFKVLAPLSDFNWKGNSFQIDDLCSIDRLDKIPDLSWYEGALSQIDKDEIDSVSHWLSFKQLSKDQLSPSEKINIFWVKSQFSH